MEIKLQKWTMEDAERLADICDRMDRSYLSERLPKPYEKKDAQWWIEMVSEKEGKEGVFRSIKVDGHIVGNISVEKKEDVYRKDAEIGYFLDTAAWSKGIMTEAVREICEIAFARLDIVRITGLVYKPNIASRKVLEKNGFELEGTMRNAVFKNEELLDLCLYGKQK